MSTRHDTSWARRTAVIRAIGTCLPPRVLTNEQIIARGRLDTTDEWITTRTGIERRRYASADVSTGDLATAAGRAALRSASESPTPGAVAPDVLLLATSTPDRPCPATAPDVAHRLGLGPVPAFDLSAVCSGFLYALATAAAFVRAGLAAQPLVVAAEKYSAIIDPRDRGTAPIFGDGAAAVKGVIGHTMGAAGAIEAAVAALSVEHQVVPTTAGFAAPDADTAPLDLVTRTPRHQRIRLALSESAGFGGHNAVPAFAPAPAVSYL
jgi:3-oxoacyl-[acyl-carrier-protein] synthase III